jgi:basic membrane protein A
MEDLTGKQLGPYQIVAPLGEGGMAAVYRAYQPAMERYVALKVLPRHFADDPRFAARFQREAKLLAQLQHPHILPVHDYGQFEGYSYIVMPFVPSGTLTDSMQGKPLPLARIRQVISQVGDALNYAHSRGMVHRDVKPSNVLIDESGNCLLTDFGLARMVETSVNLTATGTIMGTPAYMAPEQGSGHKIDARSDIYSLGIILYEMATGRVPYRAETPIAVVYMHISSPLPLPRSVNPDLPEAVERVILKALAKNPDERYQTAGDLVAALDRAIAETPAVTSVSETPPTTEATYVGVGPTLSAPLEEPARMAIAPSASKRRLPGWALGLTVGVVVLLAAGGIILAKRTTGPLPSAVALVSPTTASALPSASLPVQAVPLPTSSPTPGQIPIEAAAAYKVALVTDIGGIDDKSFNTTAWKGVQDAIDQLGVDGKFLQSKQQTDYDKNIQEFVQEGYPLIVTVGFLLGPATAKGALANPDVKFAIVDYSYPDCYPGAVVGRDCGSETAIPSVRGLTFQTDQAAFLAGYLAAGMSTTKKVGTFGGLQIPTVTIFMKGFQAGVEYYNSQKGDSVQVLGWDTAADQGLFTGTFTDPDKGKTSAKSLIDEGADVILPVAGLTGNGAFTATKEAGNVYAIGVDTDQCVSVPDACSVLLTSVRKNMDVAVFDTVKSSMDGTFQGGVNYVGTLENDGVSIAPFHDLDSAIPAALKTELDQVKADLISGAVKTGVAPLQ